MTKQHFVALADSLRSHNAKGDHVNPFREDQIEALADFCAAQNHAFNRERWLAYVAGECGPNGGKRKATPAPLAALRHHVSGAIARGEAEAIAGIPA